MPTVAAKKKAARKVARRPVAKAIKPGARLTPPPAMSAREVMADYPEPSPDFDAKGVERIIACRAER